MNLHTLRDRTNYSTFRAIGAGFGAMVVVSGMLTTAGGVVIIKSVGWAAAPAIIGGILIIASGVFAREASQLIADVPDLLSHTAHLQRATSRVVAPAPVAVPTSDDELPTPGGNFNQVVDEALPADAMVQSPQDMLDSAREMLRAGQKDECKALLRELISRHPKSPEADRARKALRSEG